MSRSRLAVNVEASPPRAESSYTLSRLLRFPSAEIATKASAAASLDEDSVAILERTDALERGVAMLLEDADPEEDKDFVELKPNFEYAVKIKIKGRSSGQIKAIPSSDDPI